MANPVITVVNRHHKDRPMKPAVYVGRPHVLGNPYVIGEDGHDRPGVIALYDKYLTDGLRVNQLFLRRAMNQLYLLAKQHGELELVCSCAPRPCHADVIKRLLDEAFTRKNPDAAKNEGTTQEGLLSAGGVDPVARPAAGARKARGKQASGQGHRR